MHQEIKEQEVVNVINKVVANCHKIMLSLLSKYFIMKKICSKCKEEKQIDDFHKNKVGKYGVHHYCKLCNSIQKKSSYNYIKNRNRGILNKYNLTLEEVESLHIAQDKKCKICNVEYPTVSKHGGLYIDHCHTTGKVRGLLCNKCNILLGISNDNVLILESAINYIFNSQI
jgi:hypothetical protein